MPRGKSKGSVVGGNILAFREIGEYGDKCVQGWMVDWAMSRTHEMAWGMSTEEAVVWRLGRESLHEMGMCREWRCIGRC